MKLPWLLLVIASQIVHFKNLNLTMASKIPTKPAGDHRKLIRTLKRNPMPTWQHSVVNEKVSTIKLLTWMERYCDELKTTASARRYKQTIVESGSQTRSPQSEMARCESEKTKKVMARSQDFLFRKKRFSEKSGTKTPDFRRHTRQNS